MNIVDHSRPGGRADLEVIILVIVVLILLALSPLILAYVSDWFSRW